MKKIDVLIQLEKIREARVQWGRARTEFQSGYDAALHRLLFEAAANYMSARDVATVLAITPKRVRELMRQQGLDSRSKTLLSQKAAEALANNSALLGIEPHEMDLMSPLAYLPMGEQMKRELRASAVSQVTEVSRNEPDWSRHSQGALTEIFKKAWHDADSRGEAGHRTEMGIVAVLDALGCYDE